MSIKIWKCNFFKSEALNQTYPESSILLGYVLPWLCTLVNTTRTLTNETWQGALRKSFCWSNFLGEVKVRGRLKYRTKKSQNLIFKVFEVSEFSTEKVWKMWIFFQVLLEIFLEQIWAWPRYEKCCSNIVLSNGKNLGSCKFNFRNSETWDWTSLTPL